MPGIDRITVVPSEALVRALEEQGAKVLYDKLEHGLRGGVITAANRIINETAKGSAAKNKTIGPKVNGKTTVNARQNRRHLVGSITVSIKWNSKSLPIVIEVHSSADPGKVGAQEFGTFTKHPDGYEIPGPLTFPWTGGYRSKTRIHKDTWKSSPMTRVDKVHHPGVKARHFMRDALDETLIRLLR